MTGFLVTLAAGTLAGFTLFKLKVPGGMMVGAIIGVSILTISTGLSNVPDFTKNLAQIMAGAFIGCSVESEDIARLKYVYKPAIFVQLTLLALNIVMGFIIHSLTSLDLMTSLLCAVPGGIAEVTLISSNFGADAAKVAVMQFARMLTGVAFFPSFIVWVARKEKTAEVKNEDSFIAAGTAETANEPRWKALLTAVLCTAVCGAIGIWSSVPSGTIVLPMFGILCLKIFKVPVFLPSNLRRAAQVLAGSYIGCSVTYRELLDLKQLALPICILLLGYLINSYLSGKILRRFFGMTLKQGMLASSPSGASDIALISADIGAQSANVVILQILRLLSAVSVFPYIMRFIAEIFG